MAIVEAKVKPQRLQDNRESYKRYWWQYAEKRGDLSAAIRESIEDMKAGRGRPAWEVLKELAEKYNLPFAPGE